MSTQGTPVYKLIRQVKASSFDSKKLGNYTLSLLVGVRDFQFCVTSTQNECLYIEDYRLEGLKTIKDRLNLIKKIFNKHVLLRSYKWGHVKLAFKSQKFTLVPHAFFIPETAGDYIILNNELNPKIESIYYYRHITSEAVNIFTADKRICEWVNTVYPSKQPQVIHQGSAFMEGILKYNDHSHQETAFAFLDRGLLHLMISIKQKVLFYNQFTVQSSEDFLKYMMSAFKELKLDPKKNKLILWGIFNIDSPHVLLLRKYFRNISIGSKPDIVAFSEAFDDVPDHRYFDLYNLFLCD